jgi:hypothetical protein
MGFIESMEYSLERQAKIAQSPCWSYEPLQERSIRDVFKTNLVNQLFGQ